MNSPKLLPLLLAGFACAAPALAQNATKAANTTSLNFAASYVENALPGTDGFIIINNTLNSTSTTAGLSANLTIGGLVMEAVPVSGAARGFSFSGGNGTLTIGAGGIVKAVNTSSLTLGNTIALGANQTWTINNSTGNGTGSFALNVPSIEDNGFNLEITGAGRLDITRSGTVNLTDRVNLNTASVIINSAATIVNLGNASTGDNFQIIKGRAIGSALNNFGVASSFGDGGTNTAIILGGGGVGDNGFFEYTGSSASSNRTFNFDRRTTGSEIRNTNASSTLVLTGNIQNNQGAASANSSYSFGGAGNITLSGTEQLKDNTDAAFVTTLNKNGTGTLTITGNNSNTSGTLGTYQGATNVNAGTLIVSGTGAINSTSGVNVAGNATFRYDSSVALTRPTTVNADGTLLIGGTVNGTITLLSGSRVGGDGTVNGNLSLGSGVEFVFGLTDTLTVSGTLSLDNTFSIASLVTASGEAIDWSTVSPGTYTLIAATGDFSNIQNFGLANAANVGGGKLAYFENGSLALSVVPEPSTWALIGVGLGGLLLLRRRQRQG